MFIELNTGRLLNLFWLDDVYVDIHNKKTVVYKMVNNTPRLEVFETEEEATQRLEEVKTKLLQ